MYYDINQIPQSLELSIFPSLKINLVQILNTYIQYIHIKLKRFQNIKFKQLVNCILIRKTSNCKDSKKPLEFKQSVNNPQIRRGIIHNQ